MKMLIIILLFFIAHCSIAQSTDSTSNGVSIDSTMLYLTGSFKEYNPARAFQISVQQAGTGDAKAMNALGMHYTQGLGVNTNFTMAVFWFTQAANNGYTKALVNLGMLYKQRSADSSGYALAVNHFSTAVQQQEPSAFFALGYMYYKGMGCTQSYVQAMTLFRQGTAIGRADCMYFIGLCYKYGFGVTANADSAGHYINKAALRGYRQANAELAFNNTNSNLSARGGTIRPQVKVNQLANAEKPYKEETASKAFVQLDGIYKGTLTEYDYSGKLVISEVPLTLILHAKDNKVKGKWQQGNDEVVDIEAVKNGNTLVFTSGSLITNIIKAHQKKQPMVFKSAQFSLNESKDQMLLTGNIHLFNTYSRESGNPISVQLARTSINKDDKPNISLYPNPVRNSFSIAFELPSSSPVQFKIFTASGELVFVSETQMLAQGKHVLTVDKELRTAGVYILSITAKQFTRTLAFIKE